MVGKPVDPFHWLKKPPALPFAAFHLPPSTLGLRHRLRLRPDTAVAPGGGRSLYGCICPSNRPFGGELSSVICMSGWIFRRRATASATALFGPWPYSSLVGGAFALRLDVVGPDFGLGWGVRQHHPQQGRRPCHQVVAMGVANIITRPVSFAVPGYGEGPERHSNYAPTTASSQWRLRQ